VFAIATIAARIQAALGRLQLDHAFADAATRVMTASARVRLNARRADDFSSNRHPALSFCLSMISRKRFAFVARENRYPLFRIMALGTKLPPSSSSM